MPWNSSISYLQTCLLRVQVSSVRKTDEICHVYCNFLPGFTCQTTVCFGIMRDRSLFILIHSLTSFTCFTLKRLSIKRCLKKTVFVVFCFILFVCFIFDYLFYLKLTISCSSDHKILFKFQGKYLVRNVYGETSGFQYQHQQRYRKNWSSDNVLFVTIVRYWWNLIKFIWSELHKIISFLTKNFVNQRFLTKLWGHFEKRFL